MGLALLAIGGLVLLWVLVTRLRGRLGGVGLGKSRAASPRLSNPQLTALRALWRWYETGNPPEIKVLAHLSTVEMADLLNKCSMDYKPEGARIQNEGALREGLFGELRASGMDELEAEVTVGMKFNQLGPAKKL